MKGETEKGDGQEENRKDTPWETEQRDGMTLWKVCKRGLASLSVVGSLSMSLRLLVVASQHSLFPFVISLWGFFSLIRIPFFMNNISFVSYRLKGHKNRRRMEDNKESEQLDHLIYETHCLREASISFYWDYSRFTWATPARDATGEMPASNVSSMQVLLKPFIGKKFRVLSIWSYHLYSVW